MFIKGDSFADAVNTCLPATIFTRLLLFRVIPVREIDRAYHMPIATDTKRAANIDIYHLCVQYAGIKHNND